MGTGDVISQKVFGEDSYDWRRTLRLFVFGCAISGPVYHQWYKFMDRVIPGQTYFQVVKKLVVDQTIMAPSIITTFFFAVGAMEGKKINNIYQVCYH